MKKRTSRWQIVAAGSVVTGALVRLHGLTWESQWGDEWMTLQTALEPTLSEVAWRLYYHPPLYQLLLHWWIKFAGSSDFAARLPTAVVGAVCIALLFVVGRTLVNEKSGALAALVLALTPYHIYYSQQIRPYVLLSLVGLGSFYFISLAIKENKLCHWIAFGVTAALVVHVHYYGFVLIGTELLVAAVLIGRNRTRFAQRRQSPVQGMLLSAIVTLVLCLPLAPFLKKALGETSKHLQQPPPLYEIAHPIAGIFFSNTPLSRAAAAIPVLIVLLLFARGLVESKRQGILWPLASATVLPVVFIWTIGQFYGQWINRGLLMIAPMVALAVALGIAGLPRRLLRVSALCFLVGVCALSIINMKLHHCREEYRPAAEYVAANSADRPIVFVPDVASRALVERYYPEPRAADFVSIPRWRWHEEHGAFDPEVFHLIRERSQGRSEVWLVATTGDRQEILATWIASQPWVQEKLYEKGFRKIDVVGFRTKFRAL